MSQNSLRVGIIGCGVIAKNHALAFQAHPQVHVVGVVDVDINRAQEFATQWNIAQAYSDVEELLSSGIDAVTICTPHPTHEALVLQAAAAGVHVMCEKPLSTDYQATQRMVAACEEAGVLLSGMFQRRWWPAAQEIKAAVTKNPAILGHVQVALHRELSYYTKDAWRGSWDADGGGVLMNQAVHYIDLLLWFMGEVVEVSGRINSFTHAANIEVEDSAVATLTFASGAMATLNLTTSATPSLGASVHVTTDKGSSLTLLEWPEGAEARLITNGHGDEIESLPAYPHGVFPNVDLRTINDQHIGFHTKQIANFVDAVLGEQELLVDGPEATKALRTLLAIYESHRTGQPVKLSDAPWPTVVTVPDSVHI